MLHKTIISTLLLTWASSVFALMPLEPLEYYDVNDLQLARTIPQKKGAAACFITQNGKALWGYRGGHIGKEFGKIIEIGAESVVITRQVQLDDGHWKEETLTLPLRKPAQGKPDSRCSHPPNNATEIEPASPSASSAPAPTSAAPLTKQEALVLAEKAFLKDTGIEKYSVRESKSIERQPNVLSFFFQGKDEYTSPGYHAIVEVNIHTRETRVIRGE